MVATMRTVVTLALWLFMSQVRGSNIPLKMNKTIQSLVQYYNVPRPQIFNGKAVFSEELLSGKMEAKALFMDAILMTYEKLINRMLQQWPTPGPQTSALPGATLTTQDTRGTEVRGQLSYLLKMVQDMRRQYQDQDKFLHGLQALTEIELDNLAIQIKALWELPLLYDEASSLSHTRANRRRRRRQIRKLKTHLSA